MTRYLSHRFARMCAKFAPVKGGKDSPLRLHLKNIAAKPALHRSLVATGHTGYRHPHQSVPEKTWSRVFTDPL